jgi:outer membrane protein assembly factor BamB
MNKKLFLSLSLSAGIIASDASAQQAMPTPDPIEGKWFGKAGFPEDRVDLGFEFKRNEKQELRAYLYSPIANFYGLECGPVSKNGETYELKEHPMTATIRDGKLEGTYFPLKAPMSLEQTETLPHEVPVPDFPPGPPPKWIVKLGAAIHAPAALREGIAYVGNTGGIFYAIRIADGSIVWKFQAGRALFGEALATNDALYFVCDNGFLFKLDRQTGKEKWRYDLGDARASRILPYAKTETFDWDYKSPRPTLADGVLYVGAGDGGFHAVKADTGERVWRIATKERIRADAAIDGPNVIVAGWDNFVRSLDRKTGREIWNKDTRLQVTSSPAVSSDKIFIGNRGGLLAPLDHKTGKPLWRLLFWGSSVESDPVLADNILYIGSSDLRRVSAIDPKDGRVIWRTDVYGTAWPRVAVTENRVYAATLGGTANEIRHLGGLCAVDRPTGRIIWRWPAPECPNSLQNGFIAGPAIDGKSLIIGGTDGALYCFDLSEKSVASFN